MFSSLSFSQNELISESLCHRAKERCVWEILVMHLRQLGQVLDSSLVFFFIV